MSDERWVWHGTCKVCGKGSVWLSPHDSTPTLCCDNCPAIYAVKEDEWVEVGGVKFAPLEVFEEPEAEGGGDGGR